MCVPKQPAAADDDHHDHHRAPFKWHIASHKHDRTSRQQAYLDAYTGQQHVAADAEVYTQAPESPSLKQQDISKLPA